MIITYSWLDQYKQIGFNTYPSFFAQIPMVDGVPCYGVALAFDPDYTNDLTFDPDYTITITRRCA